MNKKQWIKIRIFLMYLLIIFSIIILVKSIIFPTNSKNYQPLTARFPEQILLDNWALIKSQPLSAKLPRYKKGYEYEYQNNNNQKLTTIQVRHEFNTDGNVSRLVSLYQNIKPATIRWQIKSYEKGFYAVFNYQNKIHLTACLKNNGYTTVTDQQFYANSLQNYLNPFRLFLWLIGIKPLTDNECYFVLLTTDVSSNLTKYESFNLVRIETLWQEWINRFSNFLR